jgi:hypothetical protein
LGFPAPDSQTDNWRELNNDLCRILRSRRVTKGTAVSAAGAIVDLCRDHLLFVEYARSCPPDRATLDLLKSLHDADRLASKLSQFLGHHRAGVRVLTSNGFRYWTDRERTSLLMELENLSTVARLFVTKYKPGRGRRADRHRNDFELAVARCLQECGITPTTARSGTFARVLERVHVDVGVSERDVHKSVRKACAAL